MRHSCPTMKALPQKQTITKKCARTHKLLKKRNKRSGKRKLVFVFDLVYQTADRASPLLSFVRLLTGRPLAGAWSGVWREDLGPNRHGWLTVSLCPWGYECPLCTRCAHVPLASMESGHVLGRECPT